MDLSADELDRGVTSAGNADFFTSAYLEGRRRAMEQMGRDADFHGLDELDPKLPAGHAYAIRTTTRLTSNFRRHYRKGAMDITPQDVIDVLNSGGVKNWVLMGLHGYEGYLPDPRATQAVDVLGSVSKRLYKGVG
jgi:hypothetical protein